MSLFLLKVKVMVKQAGEELLECPVLQATPTTIRFLDLWMV
jgi:hypothetical protein